MTRDAWRRVGRLHTACGLLAAVTYLAQHLS